MGLFERGCLMEVTLGTEAMGREGSLGHIERFIFNQSQKVSDIVIKHGIFPREKGLDLGLASGGDDDKAHFDIDQVAFDALQDYTDAGYRGHLTRFSSPPSNDNRSASATAEDYQLDEAQAYGAVTGLDGKPMGYPGGEVIVSDDARLTVLAHGSPVFDSTGQQVGEVKGASVESTSGALTRLTVAGSSLFAPEHELPMDWVDGVSIEGLNLNVEKATLEHLRAS